jgi:hypothetical protein
VVTERVAEWQEWMFEIISAEWVIPIRFITLRERGLVGTVKETI